MEVILKVQTFILLESSRKTKKKGEDRDQVTREDIQVILALSLLLHHSTGCLCDMSVGLSTNEQNQKYKTDPKTALSDGLK